MKGLLQLYKAWAEELIKIIVEKKHFNWTSSFVLSNRLQFYTIIHLLFQVFYTG